MDWTAILLIVMLVWSLAVDYMDRGIERPIEAGARCSTVHTVINAPVGAEAEAEVVTVSSQAVHLPGPKEIRIADGLEPELKWATICELRRLGYRVTENLGAPLVLKVELTVLGDPEYIYTVYLIDPASRKYIAQGRGRSRITIVTDKRRLEAKKEALINAIRDLH